MAIRDFTVRLSRDGAAWMAEIVELPGAHTWAPTQAELPAHVDELIRLVAELPDDEPFGITWTGSPMTSERGTELVLDATAKLEALKEHRAQLEEEIQKEAERAAAGLRLHVAERTIEGETFDRELLRELYWNQPSVRVSAIREAIGARSAQEVIREAGPGRFEQSCRGGCGRTVVRVVSSRSAAQWPGYLRGSRDPRMCDECNARRAEERRLDHGRFREAWEREHAEHVRLLRDARAGGVEPSARYVEYPGVPGTWRESD